MEQDFMNLKNGTIPHEGVPGENGPVAAKAQPGVSESPYAYLGLGLKKIFGEDFSIDDRASQDYLLHYLYHNNKQNERLKEVLEGDPRLAQMLLDMINGKRNASSAVARYFGRSLVEVDENSPEYEEMMLADEEHRMEAARMANERAEYESNLGERPSVRNADMTLMSLWTVCGRKLFSR